MTKDEALDLALEVLEKSVATCFDRYAHEQVMSRPEHFINQAITAIKQARALDKMAENARELGLDYEPADGTQVSKVWWDGEKLMAKPIPLADFYQPVQEPDLIARLKHPEDHYEFTDPKKANAVLMSLCQEAADALAAPVQEPVAYLFTNVQSGDIEASTNPDHKEGEREMWYREPLVRPPAAQPSVPKGWKLVPVMPAAWIDSVMEQAQVFASAWSLVGSRFDSGNEIKNAEQAKAELRVMLISPPTPQPAAQPAVPDAIHHTDLSEHPQYIEGWNDCRAEMLKGMKP
jgi:hypothetical protein